MDEVSVLRLLRFAALLCLLEALGVVVMAVIEIITVDSSRLAVGLTTTVFFVVYAAGLAVAARALARIRSWARAPLLLAQLIQLGLAWSFSGSGTAWVTVLLAVPAVVVGVIVILPVTAEVLYGSSDRDDARSR